VPPHCFEGASQRLVVEVLFGRNIGERHGVSEADFQRFVDRWVTPRFPAGFSLIDMAGQYRGSAGEPIVLERGKYLLIALADETREFPLVREIANAYKREFRQESVAIIARPSCVAL
jgi:hypothetical protein